MTEIATTGITLSNWRQHPQNRWGFCHTRELMPTAMVRRDPHRVWQIPEQLRPELADVEFTTPDGRRRTVREWMDESCGDGLLVMKDGRIVYEQYAGGLDRFTNHILMSVTKSVTGVMTGLVADRCGLDVDAPIADVVPEVSGGAYGECTVRHLLDMTVSLDYDEDYEDASGAMTRYREAAGWIPTSDPSRRIGLQQFLRELRGRDSSHGAALRYLSPNSDMLGWVLERAAGVPFATMLGEWLWAPMGAEAAADMTLDHVGAPRTAGGMATTLRDLGRFIEMMRCGGVADGRQLVPAWWVEDILGKGDPDLWRACSFADMLPNGGRYRSQWYMSDERGSQTMGAGIFGQWMWFDRDRGVSIAKFTSRESASDTAHDDADLGCFAALAAAV